MCLDFDVSFYIYPLEEFCYKISVYIWSVLLSTTYDNGYGNTSIEYGLSGTASVLNPYGSAVVGEGPAPEQPEDKDTGNDETKDANNKETAPTSTPSSTMPQSPEINTGPISKVSVEYDPAAVVLTPGSAPTSTPGPPPMYNTR